VQAWVLQGEPDLYDRARRALDHALTTGHAEAYLASASFKLNTGDAINAVKDLATALIRAPMLAQAHEMAGRVLVELGSLGEARHHYETASALDPTRTPVISMELARLDALEGWWERADRRIETLLEDPDRSLIQLASVFQSRLAGWRGDRDAMLVAAQRFAPRMGSSARSSSTISHATHAGKFTTSTWQDSPTGGIAPRARPADGLQPLRDPDRVRPLDFALETLEEADRRNFRRGHPRKVPDYDRLLESRYRVYESVAERAASVLMAFRSAG
jgi:hypothetical protein